MHVETVALVVVASLLGLMGMEYLTNRRRSPSFDEALVHVAIAAFGAIILLASLALLRHCGLRLMPVREARAGPDMIDDSKVRTPRPAAPVWPSGGWPSYMSAWDFSSV